jgi:tRNA(His) guanylyltransferase
MTSDVFGDRMKDYESRETGPRFLPMIPIYARIDGSCFSSFTKGFEYPYDVRFREAMIQTTKRIVEVTNARIGYTQSDEISLCWLAESYDASIYFAGKKYKMISGLSGLATVFFNQFLTTSDDPFLRKKADLTPTFDARVYQLPTLTECTNTFLWREVDATKNALSMAARSQYPAKELFGKKAPDLHEMLYKKDINFNDYPVAFKRGVYLQHQIVQRRISDEKWATIPVARRPTSQMVNRREVAILDLPPLSKVANRNEVIFNGAIPLSFQEPK